MVIFGSEELHLPGDRTPPAAACELARARANTQVGVAGMAGAVGALRTRGGHRMTRAGPSQWLTPKTPTTCVSKMGQGPGCRGRLITEPEEMGQEVTELDLCVTTTPGILKFGH